VRHAGAEQTDEGTASTVAGTGAGRWLLSVSDPALDTAVTEVLVWLRHHPHRDYLDAAFAVVADPYRRSSAASSFSTGRWPELIEAVKEATQNLADVT